MIQNIDLGQAMAPVPLNPNRNNIMLGNIAQGEPVKTGNHDAPVGQVNPTNGMVQPYAPLGYIGNGANSNALPSIG